MAGLIGGLSHWIRIGKKYFVLNAPISSKCYGLEAVKADIIHKYAPSLNISHFDLILILHRMIKSLFTPQKNKHVKGHQDGLGHALDLCADMNTLADLKTKLVLWEEFQNDIEIYLTVTPEEDLPLISCNYVDKNQHVTYYLSHSLKDIITGYDIQQYWLRKGKWEEGNTERVNTSAFKNAISNAPRHKRVSLVEWNSGFFGVGNNIA